MAQPSPAPAASSIPCPNPACGAEVPSGRDRCLYCDTSVGGGVASSWVVDVAGRPVTIPATHAMLVGRDEESPLAQALEPKINVSRRHCELRVQGSRLQVRDLGSTNGTYVDDRPVGDAWEDVPDGSRLRLASDVEVCVSRRG